MTPPWTLGKYNEYFFTDTEVGFDICRATSNSYFHYQKSALSRVQFSARWRHVGGERGLQERLSVKHL